MPSDHDTAHDVAARVREQHTLRDALQHCYAAQGTARAALREAVSEARAACTQLRLQREALREAKARADQVRATLAALDREGRELREQLEALVKARLAASSPAIEEFLETMQREFEAARLGRSDVLAFAFRDCTRSGRDAALRAYIALKHAARQLYVQPRDRHAAALQRLRDTFTRELQGLATRPARPHAEERHAS